MEKLSDVFRSMNFTVNTPSNETEEERKKRLMSIAEAKCKSFNESEGDLHLKDGYDCKLCKNKGGEMFLDIDRGTFYETYRPCRCMKIRSMIAKMERSGLKNVIKDYTFEKYETTDPWQEQMKKAAVTFTTDDAHTWFFIGGMSGTGKTHLCTAVAVHYLRQNKDVKYMLWRDEITKIKSVINDNEAYGKAMEELKKTEVLYIDDLFKMGKDASGTVQKPTMSDINIAFEILNYRYNNKNLITIISSERTLHDIIDIDDAIGGRISEMTVPYGYYIGIKYDPKKNYRTKGIIEL